MANVLVVPVCPNANGQAVSEALAASLSDATVFRAFGDTHEAEKLLAAGKSDDWMDLLMGRVSSLESECVVIKGINPDSEQIYLCSKNVELASSFNARVVFAAHVQDDNVDSVARRLNLAKQAYAHSNNELAGFVLDGANDAAGASITVETGLTYLGSSESLRDTTSLFQQQAGQMSPAKFRFNMMEAARSANKRIVLPEGAEPRTVQAAASCQEKGLARCVLLATRAEVEAVAAEKGIKLPESLEIIDPASIIEDYVAPMVEMRKSKGLTPDQAREQLKDTVVLGTMMMAENHVDGLVSGAVNTTANTIRPALQLIKTAPGASLVSSVFFMLLPGQVLVYGDCAVNPEPNAEELAEIAIQSADSAAAFGIEPRVALISYSTGTSGTGPAVEKVAQAVAIAQQKRPDLIIDGPLQYDAASVESVAKSKAPNSKVAGKATVFIFPDLNTGNCTYKAVQRNANVLSVGPMLQGLNKPVNDLSRGALIEDIVYTIALTAIQAVQMAK